MIEPVVNILSTRKYKKHTKNTHTHSHIARTTARAFIKFCLFYRCKLFTLPSVSHTETVLLNIHHLLCQGISFAADRAFNHFSVCEKLSTENEVDSNSPTTFYACLARSFVLLSCFFFFIFE